MNFNSDERAPLDMTSISSIQVIRVCPHCKGGNQVGKHWFAGKCRNCDKHFNRDEVLPLDEMEGKFHMPPVKLIDTNFTSLKGEMETRAYAYKDEQEQIKRDGKRKRSVKNPLWNHLDGKKYRK